MTQLEQARAGAVTKEMEAVAKEENIKAGFLREMIENGAAVIPASIRHENLKPIGIGAGLRTKINANIGSSPNKAEVNFELEKLKAALDAGADTVMDLSTGGNVDEIRQAIIKNSPAPVGTVPIYQAVIEKGDVAELSEDDFFNIIKRHIRDGVDFITVHCGVTKKTIPLVKKRLTGVVSRGGSMILKWMIHNNKENPFYENFDKLLGIVHDNDVTLSLGDGLRPGCLKDATDKAQLTELNILGGLTKRAWKEGIQVIIEGPGHVPLDQIKFNVEIQKKECFNAPFYVLGPLVTDIAPGYDHITSAIGGALAAYYGADFLCFVTPAEHLRLPNIEDVREGVIASRIAAHAADIAKGIKQAREWDDKLSKARADLNWDEMMKLAINPKKAREMREECKPDDPEVCSMCGRFCSLKVNKELGSKLQQRVYWNILSNTRNSKNYK